MAGVLPITAFIQNRANIEERILAFDPGETIGWAFIDKGQLAATGQVKTADFTLEQLDALIALFTIYQPTVVVYESYRVYSWKTDDHAWNEVHTAQIIGIIRRQALVRKIPYIMQTAQIAKQFVTDDKLVGWGVWQKGQRHARDAMRHGFYWLMFGDKAKTWNGEGAPRG